ncbi:acid protease [Gigaspora margarita]|uniref:Acid protease n=1 Tax=Gigaspora margarita TaxID=4874 RepID=A0A8H4B238_GIGMA|nr:acid protease [Gigaspora margarita]
MNIYTLIIFLYFTIFIIDSAPINSKSNSISIKKISPKHSLKEVHQFYKDYFMLKYQNIYATDQDKLASAKKRLSESVNLTISNFLGYYGEFTIGNQAFKTIFDLGSSDLWVPSQKCTQHSCRIHKRFNESLSKTFNPIGTPFSIEYGAGAVTGITGKDNVLVGGIETVGQIFGLVKEEIGKLFALQEFDGIFGMGFDANSKIKATTPFSNMVEQKAVTNPYFGIYLQRSNDTGHTGTLTLGDIDTTKFIGNLNYNNVSTYEGEYKSWILDVDDISINGIKLNFKNRQALFDTGNNLVFMSYEDAATYHKFINGSSLNNDGIYTVPCNTTDQVAYIIGGVSYNIDQSDLTTGSDCSSSVQPGGGGDMWLIGDAFLGNVYSVYNIKDFTIGFAPVSK